MKLEDGSKAGLTIDALSIGRGVPEPTLKAYRRIKRVLEQGRDEGMALTIREKRIGLEGETRMCIEFEKQQDMHAMMDKIKPLTTGIELLNVETKRCPD